MKPRSGIDLWHVAALIATTSGLGVSLLLTVRHNLVFGLGDANSHVVIPRRVFDNLDASITQLGTHWGPAFQVLQLPLVWIGPLFRSGASGVAVSFLSSLVTAHYLYRLALLLDVSRRAAFLGAVLLATSPNFAYAGVIPMEHSLIMATATANVYYLCRWAIAGEGLSLLWAGLSLSAATLTHFDTWILLPLELGVVLLVSHHRWRSHQRTEATVLLWLLAGCYGIALFFLMNVAIYHDPFAFTKPFRAGTHGTSVGGASLGGHTGLKQLLFYPRTVWVMAGPVLTVTGLIGVAAFSWRNRSRPLYLVALLLFYPVAWYTMQAATIGTLILPGKSLRTWNDLRYTITILPALTFFVVAGLRGRLILALTAGAIIASSAWMVGAGRVGTWEEALASRKFTEELVPAATWLGIRARDSRIIVPIADDRQDAFERLTGLPLTDFIDSTDTREWRLGRRVPSSLVVRHVRWIVVIRDLEPALLASVLSKSAAHLCAQFPLHGRIVRIYATTGQSCTPSGASPSSPPPIASPVGPSIPRAARFGPGSR